MMKTKERLAFAAFEEAAEETMNRFELAHVTGGYCGCPPPPADDESSDASSGSAGDDESTDEVQEDNSNDSGGYSGTLIRGWIVMG